MKVDFIHKNGRVQTMDKRYADVLQKIGRGTYQAHDMHVVPAAAPVTMPAAPVAKPNVSASEVAAESETKTIDDGLDGLDAAALHTLAKDRGIEVHHRAGADKVRAALRGAAQ